MKNLSKFVVAGILIAAAFFTTGVKAQTAPANTFRFDIGAESGLTSGAVTHTATSFIGFTGRLQYGLSQNFALTLTSGYYDFLSKRYASMGMIPVKFGARYAVGRHIYLSGEVGAGFELSDFGAFNDGQFGIPKSTKLIWSPGVGYTVKSWDFGLRYENFSSTKTFIGERNNYGFVGLRVAYGFGL
jgi:hypothetical protein